MALQKIDGSAFVLMTYFVSQKNNYEISIHYTYV